MVVANLVRSLTGRSFPTLSKIFTPSRASLRSSHSAGGDSCRFDWHDSCVPRAHYPAVHAHGARGKGMTHVETDR